MARKLFATIVLALLVVACSPNAPAPALDVSERTPAPDATGVPVGSVVTATFSQPVDPATITADSFTLTTGSGDALLEVAGTVTYDAGSRTATFTPAADLMPNSTYTATLASSVASAAGRALGAASTWSFTTVNVPGVTIAGGDRVLRQDAEPVQLTAVVWPADDTVTWASSDAGVVSVDAAGLMTVVGAGTATVSATSDTNAEFSDEITVTVAELLEFGAPAEPGEALANIETALLVAPPTLASTGHGELTWAITEENLPEPFVVPGSAETGNAYPDSPYELTFDPATGIVSGSTGFPGTYEWTLTVTDELGQTDSIVSTLNLGVSLEYVHPETDEPVDPYVIPDSVVLPYVIVPGSHVRLSGVKDTRDLEPAFLAAFTFALDEASEALFEVNTKDGTITYNGGAAGQLYDVTVTATYGAGGPSGTDTVTIQGPAATP